MSDTIHTILKPYIEGVPVIHLTGRSLYDLDVIPNSDQILQLKDILHDHALQEHQLLVLSYSLAAGPLISLDRTSQQVFRGLNPDVSSRIRDYLINKGVNINSYRSQNANDFLHAMRSLFGVAIDECTIKLAGKPIKFCILFEFTEHLMPKRQGGGQSDPQIIASEATFLFANSERLKDCQNYVILNGLENHVDNLIIDELPMVKLAYPNKDAKEIFLRTLRNKYNQAVFEQGLDNTIVANLTCNTPNKGIERIVRSSHFVNNKNLGNNIIQAGLLTEQKQRDIEILSEGTLTLLNTERVKNVELKGRNISHAWSFLKRCAEGIKENKQHTPLNVLLIGSPSSGKTDLAIKASASSKVPFFQMNSPKGQYVGQTEERSRKQQEILKEMYPNIGFIDEITEAFPMQRSNSDMDSGATASVVATLLTALSDKSRAGKSMIIGTTNCPWRIGSAMLSRFICLPVLSPLKEDYPAIIQSIIKELNNGVDLAINKKDLNKASNLFYKKKISPRLIRTAIQNAIGMLGDFTVHTVLFAAEDICEQDVREVNSMIYADYCALKITSSKSFLPWFDSTGSFDDKYPFPDYLKKVVDSKTGSINRQNLSVEIDNLKDKVNV
ncbi:MAG: hypothetical protein COB67_09605 [SAR324 cluster bacterium]|uniref:AAA+ ATPase domain-containing protein n=1 Tax=SAR324 cluster bacterium TaxID=2024889 RepID=A0A2A4T169_9DELT|nr:MAG: hypothetical protein COB67_09605 [SAR324 cluster bacterium]